ncbi:tRNA 2-selenouridine(34) synthase MnmH [Candidatus Woesearchaeota archaeon]|nr:tRNA 2-selenouridine(34) synthase MnmH [Candidatus Woesearchaeota archaeon]
MVTKINVEEALKEPGIVFLDTRTPKEFAEDHVLDAVNLPLLSDEERAVVGTIYKQVSQEKAIEQGIEFFSKKMPQFIKEAGKYKDKKIVVYCWRGGMRSRTVTSLLESFGYNVRQLEGGYKKYREYVRERLYNYPLTAKLIVLCGLTCTGKTDLLQKLSPSLDLEGLAQHRGSLYGAVGLQPRTQKMFENLLLRRLDELKSADYIYVEGEGRKIGDLMIPDVLWKAMSRGTKILITRDFDLRVRAAVEEYLREENIPKIKEVTQSLWKVIGKKNKEEVLRALEKKEYAGAVKILLRDYYDLLYGHTLRDTKFQAEINSDSIGKAVVEIRRFVQSLVQSLKES